MLKGSQLPGCSLHATRLALLRNYVSCTTNSPTLLALSVWEHLQSVDRYTLPYPCRGTHPLRVEFRFSVVIDSLCLLPMPTSNKQSNNNNKKRRTIQRVGATIGKTTVNCLGGGGDTLGVVRGMVLELLGVIWELLGVIWDLLGAIWELLGVIWELPSIIWELLGTRSPNLGPF